MNKKLTNEDILASQGLVEIYDPAVDAYRQVPKEQAERMVANMDKVKKSLKAAK